MSLFHSVWFLMFLLAQSGQHRWTFDGSRSLCHCSCRTLSKSLCVCCKQKAKLEAKLHQTTSAAAAAASGVGPIHNSVPSNASCAPGFFIHPSDVIPPTPKTTPLFMTPPLTPPNEAVSAAFSAELAHLFPGSMMDPGPVNLAAHKNSQKVKPVSDSATISRKQLFYLFFNGSIGVWYLIWRNHLFEFWIFIFFHPLQTPMGSGLALAISQASHFLQPPPHQSIIIERMHSGMPHPSHIYLFFLVSSMCQTEFVFFILHLHIPSWWPPLHRHYTEQCCSFWCLQSVVFQWSNLSQRTPDIAFQIITPMFIRIL